MREITVKLYQFDELSEKAKEKARKWFRDAMAGDSFYLDDIYASLKATFKAAGIKLTDWSLGPYNHGNSVSFDLGNAGALTGARALAWLENNLLAGLRITAAEFAKKRKDYMSYGDLYRVGKVKPCPLTGICYDEEFLESLQKDIKSGTTLKEAFRNLAELCGQLLEEEWDYRNEDKQIDETILANESEFTEEGKRA